MTVIVQLPFAATLPPLNLRYEFPELADTVPPQVETTDGVAELITPGA